MKKIILLGLTALMMMGCDIKPGPHYGTVFVGDNWEIFLINDSTYLMIPKYKEYHTPHVLNINDKGNCCFCKECRQKELKESVEQAKVTNK